MISNAKPSAYLSRRILLLTVLVMASLSVAFFQITTPHTAIITTQWDGVTSQLNRSFASNSSTRKSDIPADSVLKTLTETTNNGIKLLPVDVRLAARSKHIREVCQTEKTKIDDAMTSLSKSKLYSRFYAPQKRVISHQSTGLTMCVQAKGGSTFWKHLFSHLQIIGVKNRRIMYSPRSNLAGIKFQSLDDFKEQISEIENRKMYVFARSPWDRLVSLYRQKLETRTPDDKEWKYMNAACLKLFILDNFEAMLKCVLHTWKKHLPDRHWEPITTRCDLCNIPYTYFGRLDAMNEEAEYMYKSWHINTDMKSLLTAAREGSKREVEQVSKTVDYQEYYKNVSSETISRIQQMYKIDIELFEFPSSPFGRVIDSLIMF